MSFKEPAFVKILKSGTRVEIFIRIDDGEAKAVLVVGGKKIPGPPIPMPLSSIAIEDITHWMGNKPTIGLTTEQAEYITELVKKENKSINDVRKHRMMHFGTDKEES